MMSMQVIFEAIAGDSTFRVAGMGIAASITLGFHPFLAVPVEHASVIDQRGRHRNDKLTHRRNLCLGTVVAYYMVHYNWSGQDCKVICAEKRARPPWSIYEKREGFRPPSPLSFSGHMGCRGCRQYRLAPHRCQERDVFQRASR
jgi:hypothetical protein